MMTKRVQLPLWKGPSWYENLREKEEALIPEAKKEHHRYRLLSANGKTGVSINFPISQTCRPTKICGDTCYAANPQAPSTWPKSLIKWLRNYYFVCNTPPEKVADLMAKELRSAKKLWDRRGVTLDFLRVNGVGDLFPEMIPVINYFTSHHPFKLWVITRKFELAAQIAPSPTLYLQLSLDRSTTAKDREAALELVRTRPRAYLSYLRTKKADATMGAAIVFNEKRREDLPFNSKTDCPVDADKLELDNIPGVGGTACAKCRKCFSDKTLERQREMLAEAQEEKPQRVLQEKVLRA